MRRSSFVLLFVVCSLFAPAAYAQAGPVEGEHEIQFWSGAGHGTNGSQSSAVDKTRELGGPIEFKSGGEVAYRFDNDARLGLLFDHISNAGLATPTPGINTVQLRFGFGWFSQKE